jgi:hypothetical protein
VPGAKHGVRDECGLRKGCDRRPTTGRSGSAGRKGLGRAVQCIYSPERPELARELQVLSAAVCVGGSSRGQPLDAVTPRGRGWVRRGVTVGFFGRRCKGLRAGRGRVFVGTMSGSWSEALTIAVARPFSCGQPAGASRGDPARRRSPLGPAAPLGWRATLFQRASGSGRPTALPQ